MFDIVTKLNRSSVVKSVNVFEIIDEASVKYLKCSADIIDGSKLFIIESMRDEKNKYSYHWQRKDGSLILRWDNAPHYPAHSTFPHHCHDAEGVHECPRVLIDEVLQEIEERLSI